MQRKFKIHGIFLCGECLCPRTECKFSGIMQRIFPEKMPTNDGATAGGVAVLATTGARKKTKTFERLPEFVLDDILKIIIYGCMLSQTPIRSSHASVPSTSLHIRKHSVEPKPGKMKRDIFVGGLREWVRIYLQSDKSQLTATSNVYLPHFAYCWSRCLQFFDQIRFGAIATKRELIQRNIFMRFLC